MNNRWRSVGVRSLGSRILVSAGVVAALWTGSSDSFAHFLVTAPARGASNPAGGPCGVEGAEVEVIAASPGETITLGWTEYDGHPGYFRVSFSLDGEAFVPPPADTAATPPDSSAADPSVFPQVLVDAVVAQGDLIPQQYSMEVTLPNVTCEGCRLQVMQADAAGGGTYFQCVTLTLSEADPPADPADPPADPADPPADEGTEPAPDPDPEPAEMMPSDPGSTTGDPMTGGSPADTEPAEPTQGASDPSAPSATGDPASGAAGPTGESMASAGCSTAVAPAPINQSLLAGALFAIAGALLARRRR